MFAAPPYGDDRVITSFLCSIKSPQRSVCPQYDNCIDDDDDNDDISSSHWSMSPGPPTPCSITSLQGPLSPSHDYNSVNSVNGGCDDCNVTASQSPVSSDLSSRKSVDFTAPGPSTPTPSPYDACADDSDDCVCDCGCVAFEWPMSSDQSSRKSDDLTGPTCPALLPYDSNTNDDNDSDEDDDYDSGFPLSRRTISPDDIVAHGSICPASTPYDSNTADDKTGGDASSQWSISRDLPSGAISQQQQQQAYDPTITAYNNDDYIATAQTCPSG